MTTPTPGSPVQYTVTGISPDQYQTDAAGNGVKGRTVHFRLADGTSDQVFVPDSQWSVEGAQAIITDAAQVTASIRALGSS